MSVFRADLETYHLFHDNRAGEFDKLLEKTNPVGDDVLLIEDSDDGKRKKRVSLGNLPGGGGEANTTTNEGGGVGLALPKVGVNLPIKTLVAGSNITITDNGQDVTIEASGGGGGSGGGFTVAPILQQGPGNLQANSQAALSQTGFVLVISMLYSGTGVVPILPGTKIADCALFNPPNRRYFYGVYTDGGSNPSPIELYLESSSVGGGLYLAQVFPPWGDMNVNTTVIIG